MNDVKENATCECTRIMSCFMKHDDRTSFSVPHLDIERSSEYAPYLNGFGGDDTRFDLCLDCGKIQDWTPATDADVKEAFQIEEEEEEDEG